MVYDTRNNRVLGLRLALSKGPNRVPPRHRRMETDPVSETFSQKFFSIPGNGQSPRTQ
jgi:hypothetical protein